MITLTLDSCVLFSGLDGSAERKAAFQAIWEIHDVGIANIAFTSRLDEDMAQDVDLERVKRHYRIARIFETIPGPFRIDMSMVGQDVIAGEAAGELEVLFGIGSKPFEKHNTVCDIDHLDSHQRAGRDYFLTYDGGILRKNVELANFGIRVLNASTFAAAIPEARQEVEATGGDLESILRTKLESKAKALST